MMKHQRRLIVMRHAKSSWSSGATTDHARPLNRRGQRAAPDVASQLVALDWQPEMVLSSDATRTRETIGLMQPQFADDVEVEFFNSLYLADYGRVLQESGVVPDSVRTLMVLGHNPGWESMVYILSNQLMEMKTAYCALLEISSPTWRNALEQRSAWKLIDLVRPSESRE